MDHDWIVAMDDVSEQFRCILSVVDTEGIGAAAQLPDRITRIFQLFCCGEGAATERMKERLGEAKEILVRDHEKNFGGAQRALDDWQGSAAENFATYLTDLQDGVALMVERIDAMIMILAAYQALHQRMRETVVELVDKTRDGIADARADQWKIGLAMLNAVVNVVGSFGRGGGRGDVATAMISGAIGVAIETIGADSELGVLVKLVDSGERMTHLIDAERARLERGLRALVDLMTGDKNLPEVRPDRPEIITAPSFDPGEFGLPDEQQGSHPKPTDTRDLVPEPERRPDGPHDQTTRHGQPYDRYEEQGPPR